MSLEMIVARCVETLTREIHFAGAPRDHVANAGQLKAFVQGWNSATGRRGKEQFVIFAPVEALRQSSAGVERRCFNLSRHIRFEAQAGQIEGQAVAQVHRRCGFVPQELSQREARFRMQMPAAGASTVCRESQRGPA